MSTPTYVHIFIYFVQAYALLTAQPAAFFWSCGFLASSLQGCAHKFTQELPTLPQLKNNLPHELSHTTYFPNLLFQAMLEGDNAAGVSENADRTEGERKKRLGKTW